MSHDSAPDNDLDEQHPEHDSVNPALEDDPTADEVGGAGRAGNATEAGANAGDDELNSGRIEPGAPQAGA